MEIEVPRKIKLSRNLVTIVVVIVVALISFYGGTRYEKDHNQSVVTASANSGVGGGGAGGFGGRFGGGTRRGVIGSVTAISSTSITVQGNSDNASHTYSITSATTITNNGQTAAASDIQTGNTVLVVADSSDASQAARILINPSFGGGAPVNSQQD